MSYVVSNCLKIDGNNQMTGDLDMNEQNIKNMLDPVDEQDSVNNRYLESQLTDYVDRNGNQPLRNDLNMLGYKIINLKYFDPDDYSDQDVVNIQYLRNCYLSRSHAISCFTS